MDILLSLKIGFMSVSKIKNFKEVIVLKRKLAIALCMAMALGTVCGCGEKSASVDEEKGSQSVEDEKKADDSSEVEEDTDKYSEHMTISVGHWDIETFLAGGESDKILQMIQDKFNVTFEPVNVTWDDYGEKFNLWASTDSLPDMFSPDVRNSKTLREWTEGGVVSALPDDLSAWPNLQEYVESTNWVEGTVDGTLYALCRRTFGQDYERTRDRVIYYRWDLAQAAGITEEPANWDEFRAMIQAIIEADPEGKDVAGLISATYKNLMQPIVYNYSIPVAGKWVDNGDGTYILGYFSGEELGENILPGFQLLRDMYAEGTIDHDITLATNDSAENKWANGQSAAYLRTGAYSWEEAYEAINGPVEDSVKVLHLMPAADGNKYYAPTEVAWSDLMFGSCCDEAKMERILDILDYLCTDEGMLLSCYGIEGENYTISADKEISCIDDWTALNELYPSVSFFANLVCWYAGHDWTGYTVPAEGTEFYQATLEQIYGDAREVTLPEVSEEAALVEKDIVTDFGTHSGDDLLTLMTGDRPVEEMWNEILEQYKADGLEEFVAQVNEQLK